MLRLFTPLLKCLALTNSVSNDSYFHVRGAFCVPSIVPSSSVQGIFPDGKEGEAGLQDGKQRGEAPQL